MPDTITAEEARQVFSRIKARMPENEADLDQLETLLAERGDLPADVRASIEAAYRIGRDNYAFWSGFFAEAKEIH